MKKFGYIHNEVGISPLTQSVNFGYPSNEMKELVGIDPFSFICVYYEDKVDMFTDLDHWQEGGKHIVEMAKNNLNFFIDLYNRSEDLKKETIDQIQKIGRPERIDLSNQELVSLFEEISYKGFIMTVLSQTGAIADHHHNIFSDLLDKTLNNAPGIEKTTLNKSEIFNILTTTPQKLPSEIAKDELRENNNIEKFLDRWHWVHFGHLGPSLNEKDAREFINSCPTENKIKLDKNQKELEDLIFEKEEDKNIFRVSRIFVYLKGMRMEVCNGIFYIFSLILDKISKETGFNKKILYFLTVPEVVEYLKSGKILSKEILESRRKFTVWHFKDYKNIDIYIEKEGENFLKEKIIQEKKKIDNTDIVKGNTAYPGKVKGIVKIINCISDMEKMEADDILVSIQTMPELLPAMKKAVAFVTDIGGITSHAAIMSREMKVPCVVGTKIATQVLKDGDEVEVDADNGIIKKLSE